MRKIFFFFLFILISSKSLFSQTITEKELFSLSFKGTPDAFNLIYDKYTGSYCYIYYIQDENQYFIISNNSISQKFNAIYYTDIKFDSNGNYYAVSSNYKADYGIDNYFIIVNGKTIMDYEYIDGYSSFIDKDGNFVFIFKQFGQYKLGYYNIDKEFISSESYESIRPIYKKIIEEAEASSEDNFFKDENGERGFVAISKGKAKFVFGKKEIQTNYSDINEYSVTYDKNNQLNFIAKKSGIFYETLGDVFVVAGNKEYNTFYSINTPLMFDNLNRPVYVATDSIAENLFINYVLIGNDKQTVYLNKNTSKKVDDFTGGIIDLSIDGAGNVNYTALQDIKISAKRKNEKGEEETYYDYYVKTFLVKNGSAEELGYNIWLIKYGSNGEMLYSGMADTNKREYLLMLNNGVSNIILNKKKFDEITEYGFTKNNAVYYVGANYENEELGKKNENYVYIDNKLIGKYEFIVFQTNGNSASIIKFDSKGNYAFVAENKIDSSTFRDYVVTNSGTLPFPSTNKEGKKRFNTINNLMFIKNDKSFYIGVIDYDSTRSESELFVDNISLGKIYNNIGTINYDADKNEMSFFGARKNKIYDVKIQF